MAWIALTCALVQGTAWALDPTRSIEQYVQTVWTPDQGVPPGLDRMVQDRAGFLWASGRDGLYRFDGLTFEKVRISSASGQSTVETMAAAEDGSMWIGRDNGAIEVYRNGSLREVSHDRDGNPISKIVQTRDGTIWAIDGGSPDTPLLRLRGGAFQAVAATFGLPHDQLIDLKAARDGSLWVTTFAHPLVLRLAPDTHRFEPVNVPVEGRAAISEDGEGRIWLSDNLGTRIVWSAGHLVPSGRRFATPPFARGVEAFWDKDGSLWGRPDGFRIFRLSNPFRIRRTKYEIPPGTVELYNTGTHARILGDREGDIWLYSSEALRRFRNSAVVAEPALTNPPRFGDILTSTSDGSVYVAELNTVYRIVPNGIPVAVLSHTGDSSAICPGPDHSVVIAFSNEIIRLKGSVKTSLGYPMLAESQRIKGCGIDARGALWINTERAGLFTYDGGKWRSDPTSTKDGGGSSANLVADAAGKLVVVRSSGILSIYDPPKNLDFRIGSSTALGPVNVLSAGTGRVLVGGFSGVALLNGRSLKMPPPWQDPRLRNLEAIIDTPEGITWMKGAEGVYRVNTRELDSSFQHPHGLLHLLVLDRVDGADADHVQDSYLNAARGGDGRVWLSGASGTRWVDPTSVHRNSLPPGVVISQLVVGRQHYLDPTNVRLPAGTSSIEIQFAALGLSRPDRVTAVYRLRGIDPSWVSPGTRRSAFYSNLGSGSYIFEVEAVNEDGVASDHIATLKLDIPATFLQSIWFKLILVVLGAMVLTVAYHLRVRHLAHLMQIRLEDRLAERERIARDLHDTLLQGFQGMILRFHALLKGFPVEAPDRRKLERALDQAETQLDDGRSRIYELRVSEGGVDLAESITLLGKEMSREAGIEFQFSSKGEDRALDPIASVEANRIVIEAMRNAFAHSHGDIVSASVEFAPRVFKIVVEDNGLGIPTAILEAGGRDRHFGLMGMRERARRMKAYLKIERPMEGGTRIIVRIPGRLAYKSTKWSGRF